MCHPTDAVKHAAKAFRFFGCQQTVLLKPSATAELNPPNLLHDILLLVHEDPLWRELHAPAVEVSLVRLPLPKLEARLELLEQLALVVLPGRHIEAINLHEDQGLNSLGCWLVVVVLDVEAGVEDATTETELSTQELAYRLGPIGWSILKPVERHHELDEVVALQSKSRAGSPPPDDSTACLGKRRKSHLQTRPSGSG